MLTEVQILQVWESMLEAETRSLYFADLASRYTRRKQVITALTFFLSSGAAATLIAKTPEWVPLVLAIVPALANAYSMAAGLDRKVATMVELHATWNGIAGDYNRLWNHVHDDDAELLLEKIVQAEREPSKVASTEAPNNQRLMGKWLDHVCAMRHLTNQHG